MPTKLTNDQLLALARLGARARVTEIRNEIAEIQRNPTVVRLNAGRVVARRSPGHSVAERRPGTAAAGH